jgi:hypothetical protein
VQLLTRIQAGVDSNRHVSCVGICSRSVSHPAIQSTTRQFSRCRLRPHKRLRFDHLQFVGSMSGSHTTSFSAGLSMPCVARPAGLQRFATIVIFKRLLVVVCCSQDYWTLTQLHPFFEGRSRKHDVSQARNVEALFLDGNELGNAGAGSVAAILPQCAALREVSLQVGESHTPHATRHTPHATRHTKIWTLLMRWAVCLLGGCGYFILGTPPKCLAPNLHKF